MAIYNIDRYQLDKAYNVVGEPLLKAYALNGDIIFLDEGYLPGRELVFEDDFNGNSLNLDNWSYAIGAQNNPQHLHFYRSTNNIKVENSCLVITAKKENHLNKEWTSGRITGHYKKSWTYGRIEAKIKFPPIKGAFPAFWTEGDDVTDFICDEETGLITERFPGVTNAECGELDIVELLHQYNPEMDRAYCTCWRSDSTTARQLSPSQPSRNANLANWHIYSAEWTDEYIACLFDGVEYKRWTFSDYDSSWIEAHHNPHFIILNLAVGGLGDTPDESTTEMTMMVDWVRVYAPLSN